MTNKNILLILLLTLFVLSSCKTEKKSRMIIATLEEPHFSKTPKVIGDTVISNTFRWGEDNCTYIIDRKAIRIDSCTVKDDEGQKYYDNEVKLTVKDSNGDLFNHTFKKGNFIQHVDQNYVKPKHSVLIGVAFNRVEKGGNAIFVATIGSPDIQSDEFVSVQINIDKKGAMTMSNLQEIQDDMDNADLNEE